MFYGIKYNKHIHARSVDSQKWLKSPFEVHHLKWLVIVIMLISFDKAYFYLPIALEIAEF